jgi:hypothetical protein
MLSQFLNQMDEHLTNKPFKRRWWSRRWIVHMTIQPPVTKDYPLWKRNKDELRLLRLFDLSPEELEKKIERYWKKPRWRRWFASFGMNRKIDVWNYYQRCLAYQAVRSDRLEQESFIANKSMPIVEDLSLVLHQSNIKFEAYLEKHCRHSKWIEKNLSEEIKHYMQGLKKTFLRKLNKSLKQIKIEGERLTIKQQAEQEYQLIEAFMFHYHGLWLSAFFPRAAFPNGRLEVSVQNENMVKAPERSLAGYKVSQTISSSPSTIPRTAIYHTDISLHRSKEWIRMQREQLNLLLKEGSLQKVEDLLQAGLNDIKMITERHLGFCDTMLSDIQGKQGAYPNFLNYLDNLQRQLKPLLQGGMLLFHPDHVLNLTHSQAMKELITRYSQAYLEQNRCYLDSLKNYHLRIEEFYLLDEQKLQRQQLLPEWSDLALRIQELSQSIKELKQSFKDFAKELREVEAQQEQDKEAMEAQRKQDKEATEARLKELEARLNNLSTPSTQQASTSPASDVNMPESSNNVAFTIGMRPSL